MHTNRRYFLQRAAALGAASSVYAGLAGCSQDAGSGAASGGDLGGGANALVPDPRALLDLPEGFSYRALSRTGEEMSDGLLVPAAHDGMECFAVPGDGDRCVLIRNHELDPHDDRPSAFVGGGSSDFVNGQAYARHASGTPQWGGTTNVMYNLRTGQVERSFLSLAGTVRNCSGGRTPWGSWISCEETTLKAGDVTDRDHGYAFEVAADAQGLAPAVPLVGMGRFEREAVAVDPSTGIVYQTEDSHASLIYRYVPNEPGALARGGRLQALVVRDDPAGDTRNWDEPGRYGVGQSWAVDWVDMDAADNPDGDIAQRGHGAGAAWFARGEGMAWAISTGTSDTQPTGAVYFACTSGGPARRGQIWMYRPSPREGHGDEASAPGVLTLVYESPGGSDHAHMDMCDNIVGAPWGHLVVCEDGSADQYVRGMRPDGSLYAIARNAHSWKSEFAGACFAPDGKTLFVNMQNPGITFAITGPWSQIALAV